MGTRSSEKVTVTPSNRAHADEELNHPAFGVTTLSRMSCTPHVRLTDSAIDHRIAINLRVYTASITRNLSHDHVFQEREVASIYFSEAQWAELVSSVGQGNGVPCTLDRIRGEPIPRIEEVARQNYSTEFRKAMARYTEAADELRSSLARIERSRMNPELKKNLMRQLDSVINVLTSSLPFILSQFQEKGEEIVMDMMSQVRGRVKHMQESLGVDDALKMLEEVEHTHTPPKAARKRVQRDG